MSRSITAEGNRLRYEKSPYLLQHAQDPVDWWSWCPGAFREAKKEDKPILLSIGYSTCHWCHVMGRETFRDRETAEKLRVKAERAAQRREKTAAQRQQRGGGKRPPVKYRKK